MKKNFRVLNRLACIVCLSLFFAICSGCSFHEEYLDMPYDNTNPGIWECSSQNMWFSTKDGRGHLKNEQLDRDIKIGMSRSGFKIFVADENGSFVTNDSIEMDFSAAYYKDHFVLKTNNVKVAMFFDDSQLRFDRICTWEPASMSDGKDQDKNGYAPGSKNGKGLWVCEETDCRFDTRVDINNPLTMKGQIRYGEYDYEMAVNIDAVMGDVLFYFPGAPVTREEGIKNNVFFTFSAEFQKNKCILTPREDNPCNAVFKDHETLTFVRTVQYDD